LSQHLAMAALEMYVHLPRPTPRGLAFVKFGVRFRDTPIFRLGKSDLPADWRDEPAGNATQAMGDDWVRSRRTAILAVPSVLIPEETNFVLNPAHPEFPSIEITGAGEFTFDPRLARLVDPSE
jgi:RES domain-containing protein